MTPNPRGVEEETYFIWKEKVKTISSIHQQATIMSQLQCLVTQLSNLTAKQSFK